jgi:predicted PurR-regulated permease PerM
VLIERVQNDVAPWLQAKGIPVMLDSASIKAFVLQTFSTSFDDNFKQALTSLRIGGSVALAVIGNLVLIPVVLFYLLADWQRFVRHVEALVPLPARPAYDSFVAECDDVLGQYLRGQLSVMALLAVYYSVALWLFGLELAFPIGVFTGLAVFVPYVGYGLGLALAILAGVLQFSPSEAMLMVAVVYGMGQLIESFVLTPRLVGERIGLHPLHVIFALMAFGQLFGFVGVLVALPASVVGGQSSLARAVPSQRLVPWCLRADEANRTRYWFGPRPYAEKFFCWPQSSCTATHAAVGGQRQAFARAYLCVGREWQRQNPFVACRASHAT